MNMFDDLAAYYHENIVSAYIDYRDIKNSGIAGRSKDIRKAIIAASALFHLREHIPPPNQTSRSATERQCPEYGLLADIVNATKHKNISSQTPHGLPLINDASQIEELIDYIEYKDKDGKYYFAKKSVIVKLLDGSTRDLFEILTLVINYWENFLFSLGILDNVYTFSGDNNSQPKTRKECEENRLNYEIVKGHRFHQSFRFLRYNYQTKREEVIDLKDVEDISISLHRPKYMIDLSFTYTPTCEVFTREISLTEDENQQLIKLDKDEDRQRYINSLTSAKEAFHELVEEARKSNIKT